MTKPSIVEQGTHISHIIPLSIFMIMDPMCQKDDVMPEQDAMLGNEYTKMTKLWII